MHVRLGVAEEIQVWNPNQETLAHCHQLSLLEGREEKERFQTRGQRRADARPVSHSPGGPARARRRCHQRGRALPLCQQTKSPLVSLSLILSAIGGRTSGR